MFSIWLHAQSNEGKLLHEHLTVHDSAKSYCHKENLFFMKTVRCISGLYLLSITKEEVGFALKIKDASFYSAEYTLKLEVFDYEVINQWLLSVYEDLSIVDAGKIIDQMKSFVFNNRGNNKMNGDVILTTFDYYFHNLFVVIPRLSSTKTNCF